MVKHTQPNITKLISKLLRARLAATVVALVVVVGTYLLMASHAQTPTASIETESGTPSGGAMSLSDSSASGGGYVKFGSSSSSGNCSTPFVSSVFCMSITSAALDDGSNNSPYPNSSTLVTSFNNEIKATGYNVGVNNGDYGIPIYRVSASQSLVTVTPSCASSSDYTIALQAPVPNGATPATGTDHSIIFYQASTGKEWEFWEFQTTGTNTYSACDGGEIPNVSSSNGVFPLSGSQVSSSGVDYLATLVTETDVQGGAINHALAMTGFQCNGYIAPARSNYDCGGGVVPYGQYFRFPSSLAMPSGLTPLAQMIFKAIQNYGMVIVDTGGAMQVGAESPQGWDWSNNTSADPITAAMNGQPEYEVIANLPWSQLQAVQEP